MLSTKVVRTTIIIGLGLFLSVAQATSDRLLESSPSPTYSRPILPEQYLIRPGETLTVTFLKTQLGNLSLEVDAESRIVNSDLGVIDLSGRNLEQTREILRDVLRQVYSVDNIAISVGRPAPVSVTVRGAVLSPGQYTGFSSQTVSEMIDSAGGVLPGGSSRRILFSGGGQSLTVDLDRARFLNDPQADPNLYAGFDIFVPLRSTDVVEVVGSVREPRQVEVEKDESVSLLIGLAGGATPDGEIEQAYLLNKPGQTLLPDEKVAPGDVIVVPVRVRDAGAERIMLVGAVERQGAYDLAEGMSVADLINRAGGARPDANLQRIAVFRLGEADVWGGSPNIRYPLLLDRETVGQEMIPLRPADSIFVPVKVGYVRLSGAVPRPGLYPFSEAKTVEYYLGLAGLTSSDRQDLQITVNDRVTSLTVKAESRYPVADGDEIILTRGEAEK